MPPNFEQLREAWQANVNEVKDSDFVLLYGRTSGKPLAGALIECGVAIAEQIKVLAVGLAPEHTWSYHHLVVNCNTLEVAREYLERFTVMIPPRRRDKTEQSDDN